MRFLTIFPEAENIHLIKDVGMLPFALQKECGYTATIACYKNGAYPYLKTELNGLKMIFIKRIFGNTFLDVIWFLIFQSRNFDVMQAYHFRFRSLFWLFIFKVFGNKKITYLKLDANETILYPPLKNLLSKINLRLLKHVNLISVETKYLQQKLIEKWNCNIILVPNGFYKTRQEIISYKNKKNTILSVGRIGAPEKQTDFLMEAFVQFSPLFPDWRLNLVGPIEPSFNTFKDEFFQKHPHLKEQIVFTGAIEDRNLLFDFYVEARVFCLPSAWEGFPLALVEAAFAGCYLMSSNFLAAFDITDNGNFGRIFSSKNIHELTQVLKDVAGMDNDLLENNCYAVQRFADQHFSWSSIATFIDNNIKKQIACR